MIKAVGANPCMICRQKNNSSTLHNLQNLKRVLDPIEALPDMSYLQKNPIHWGVVYKCRYGMPKCSDLMRMDRDSERLIAEIEPKLLRVGMFCDDDMYYLVLRNLRGEFSAVYTWLERYRALKYKRKSSGKSKFENE